MSMSDSVRVKTEQLPVGSKLSHPINDNDERLLLAAGSPITAAIKERLIRRGIYDVWLHPDDAASVFGKGSRASKPTKRALPRKSRPAAPPPPSTPATRAAEISAKVDALAASASLRINNAGPPLRDRATAHGCSLYGAKQSDRLAQQFTATKELLDEMVQQALSGAARDMQPLSSTTAKYTTELTSDADCAISSSVKQAPNPDFTERGVRLAILGMALAIELGWDEPNTRSVGLCGLVHDWGMFRLAKKLQNPRVPLLAADWSEMVNHPLHTVDMLSTMANISDEVCLAASQLHENCDGSGYPRGLGDEQIHPYAKILHVADAYITLTAEMRGRRPYLHYDAMVYLLHQVKAGRMEEKAMRGLVNVLTLFPIGSHVRLSDGSEAQVIRRSATQYTAPIVQRVGGNRQVRMDDPHPSIVDLSQSKLRVMAPLVTPGRQEVRIEDSLVSKILWDGPESSLL